MNIMLRTVFSILTTIFIIASGPAVAWADCGNEGVAGINIGIDNNDGNFVWTFSLVNLTSQQITIQPPQDNRIGSNFPYYETSESNYQNNIYYAGNSNYKDPNPQVVGHTTWKSNEHTKMFPDACRATVTFQFANDSSYNFSLVFDQDIAYHPQRSVIIQFKPPYGTSTWKYNTSVSNDNGYYAFNPRAGNEGILFAISDKYVICAYKPNKKSQGGNHLILVVTPRDSNLQYQGSKLQWFL